MLTKALSEAIANFQELRISNPSWGDWDVLDIVEEAARSMIDLVSSAEIAERLGVKKMTVHQWRYRGIFPEPDWQLSIGPVWKWSTIQKWAEKTNRI